MKKSKAELFLDGFVSGILTEHGVELENFDIQQRTKIDRDFVGDGAGSPIQWLWLQCHGGSL